jgi:HEPN domain-containing protein
LTKAESDLADARRCAESPGPYDTACFHCQQACEKYLKGFLAFHNHPFPFTHDLERLTRLCQAVDASLDLTREDVVALTDYAVKLRYDNEFWPSQSEAAEALVIAEEVRGAIKGRLPPRVLP